MTERVSHVCFASMNRQVLSCSSCHRYSEEKSSTASHCPPIKSVTIGQNTEKSRSLYRSLDTNAIDMIRKQQISSQFTPKTARSVTIRWTDQSIATFSTVIDAFHRLLIDRIVLSRYRRRSVQNNFSIGSFILGQVKCLFMSFFRQSLDIFNQNQNKMIFFVD